MKKLLSILSAVMLVSSASLPVVGCSIGSRVDESIDPVLEQQNFNVLANTPEEIENILKSVKPSDFYFSNGFDGDNKFISDRSNGIDGSFGASKWTFIDMLNTKLKLGLKRSAKQKDGWNPDDKTTVSDVENNAIDWNVENFEKLKDIKVIKVTGTYQEGGDKPVDNDNDNSIKAFNNIVRIGDTANWGWQDEVKFLKSSYFADRTYTKKTTFVYEDQSFTFTQLIKLGATGLFNVPNKDKTIPIDNKIESLREQYEKTTGVLKGKDLPGFSFDNYMDLIFSNMNIFTAERQDYSVAIDLDCNNLLAQFNKAINNSDQLINDYINANNQKILANYFEKNLTKNSSDDNSKSDYKKLDGPDSTDTSSLKISDGTTTILIPFTAESGYIKTPRIGMPLTLVENKTDGDKTDDITFAQPSKAFINELIAYINFKWTGTPTKFTADQFNFKVVNTADDPAARKKNDLVLKTGDKIVITPIETPAPAPQLDTKITISGEADLVKLSTDNMNSKEFSSKNKDLDFIYVPKNTELSKNDWLSSNLGIYSTDDLDKKSINYWIDLAQQKQNGPVGILRSQIFKGDINDVIKRINETIFISSLNKDGLLTTNTIANLTDADYSNPINLNFDINGTLDK